MIQATIIAAIAEKVSHLTVKIKIILNGLNTFFYNFLPGKWD